jgi:hypothetical protein
MGRSSLLKPILYAAVAGTIAFPTRAQTWFDTAAIMQPVVLNPCPGGRCPDLSGNSRAFEGGARNPPPKPTASSAASVDLTYAPSADRRRANLAKFIAKTRAENPASADQMAQLFTSTDVFAQIGSAISPHGYAVTNLGDAYSFWWMTAWKGAQGSNEASTSETMKAVRSQAHRALATDPQVFRATDARKQELAEALWIQAAMIDAMVDMAKQRPDLMPQLQRAIRRGARASGVDLDTMRLTAQGFTTH